MRLAYLTFVALVLASCSSGPVAISVAYTPPATPGGRLCVNQCTIASTYCRDSCDLVQRQCVAKVQETALRDYDSYTREQFKSGGVIELRPRDFERMSPCDEDKKSCSAACESRYQSCYKDCGGTVDISTSCQSFCF